MPLIAAEVHLSARYLGVTAAPAIFLADSALTGQLLGLGTRRPTAVALLLITSMRDFAIAAGLAVAAFGPSAAAPLGLYEILVLAWGTAAAGVFRRLRPDRSGPETEPGAAVAIAVTAGPSWPCDAPHAGTACSRLGCMATWLQVRRGSYGGGAATRFARHPGAMNHPHASRDDAGHHRDHGHEHEHEHSESQLVARLRHVLRPHSHEAADQVDAVMEGSAEGMRVVWISLGVLGLTALIQAVVAVLSGRWHCWATRCITPRTR